MEQDAHKEHDGRHRAHEPVQQRRPVFELGGIVTTRQHPSKQREDHKPGVIQTNRGALVRRARRPDDEADGDAAAEQAKRDQDHLEKRFAAAHGAIEGAEGSAQERGQGM